MGRRAAGRDQPRKIKSALTRVCDIYEPEKVLVSSASRLPQHLRSSEGCPVCGAMIAMSRFRHFNQGDDSHDDVHKRQ